MIMHASIPVENGNAAAESEKLGSTIQQILADLKPEAAYFTADDDGRRSAFVVFDMQSTSQIPAIAEPWFLAFNASITIRPAMTAQDLAEGLPGMQKAVKAYGKAAGR
jgi:hypothetical protein